MGYIFAIWVFLEALSLTWSEFCQFLFSRFCVCWDTVWLRGTMWVSTYVWVPYYSILIVRKRLQQLYTRVYARFQLLIYRGCGPVVMCLDSRWVIRNQSIKLVPYRYMTRVYGSPRNHVASQNLTFIAYSHFHGLHFTSGTIVHFCLVILVGTPKGGPIFSHCT